LNGANTVSYNVPYTFKYPQILGLPKGVYDSVPDGVYNMYLWLSPAPGPFVPYSSVTDARDAIQTQIVANYEEANGLKIIMESIVYPQCPSTDATIPINVTGIAVNIRIIDQNWNGPYYIYWATPSGRTITNVTIDINDPEACGIVCATLLTNNTACSACNIYIRDQGIPYSLYIGTGISSPNEQGLYRILVRTNITECVASYFPDITPMNPFLAQVACSSNTCAYRQDGVVYAYVDGGTKIPYLLTDLIQNSDLTLAVPRYHYYWNVTTQGINGTNTTANFTDVLRIPFAVDGFYELTAVDYNGCVSKASCQEVPLTAQLELILVSSSSPNCSNEQGNITVAIKNNTGTPPFTLYKVGVDQHPIQTTDGYILSDLTVKPGQEFFYMVCDANECCSPMLNLSIAAPAGFIVRLKILQQPCSATVNSGQINAQIVDNNGNPYTGNTPTFQWFFNGVPYDPLFTGATLSGAGVGVWMVVATNILGCTSSDTIALSAGVDLGFSITRTDVNVENGIIQGIIYGGNGNPYTMTVQPSSNPPSPPDIGNTVIINVQQATTPGTFTYYKISQVPPQANIFITVTDRIGCAFRNESRGGKIPIDKPIIVSPSPTPNPHDIIPIDNSNVAVIAAVSSIIVFVVIVGMCCWCVLYFNYDPERLKRLQKKQVVNKSN
jgi:hypothetical protein